MLNTYIQQTQRLLHDPNAALYSTSDLTAYINEARRQLAMEGQCIRNITAETLAPSTNFLSLAGLTGTGLLFPIDVMAIYASSSITSGPVTYRPWPWYFRYNYFSGLTGHPTTYSLLQNANGGTLLFDPEPSVTVTLQLELIWFPIDLVDDSTPEFIPVPWQDCVKFYAAYLAYSNSQRTADADGMMGKFQTYLARARRMTKPTQLPGYSNQDWSQQSPPGAPPRAQ